MIRDVKLMIEYAWIWRHDFRPGEDSPGRTVYITIHGDIAPHAQQSFSYQPSPPLSSRHDGHFEPAVKVVGYADGAALVAYGVVARAQSHPRRLLKKRARCRPFGASSGRVSLH